MSQPINEQPINEQPINEQPINPEDQERMDEINELIKADKLDPTTSMNILINAVQVSFDKDHFNELDRYLIAKALTKKKKKVDNGEDFTISVG